MTPDQSRRARASELQGRYDELMRLCGSEKGACADALGVAGDALALLSELVDAAEKDGRDGERSATDALKVLRRKFAHITRNYTPVDAALDLIGKELAALSAASTEKEKWLESVPTDPYGGPDNSGGTGS